MKRLTSFLIATLLLASIASAIPTDHEMVRVIARTTSLQDKFLFRMQGCSIIHELDDATALKCPKGKSFHLAVEEDQIYHIMDMDANVQINADDVWALGYTGSGVTVAILDTGIDTDHPELADSIAGGKGFGYTTYEDDNGHGTHVSGIITADGVVKKAKGVAPDAKVWMAKVCDASGSCYGSDIEAAIEYVVEGDNGIPNTGDEPAKIISISLGGGGTSRSNCDSDYLASKVNWAVSNGVTVVVAAGNNGRRVSSPACASGAIAVGAVDKNDVRASWSGSGYALDIMAPGVSIYSSVMGGGYDSWSGTSMSTPHVSATVALMKQVNPSLTDSQIKDALYNTAVDLGSAGWDRYYGWGRVNALGAVNYVMPEEPECTVDANCNDGISCTDNSCDNGVCVYTINDAECQSDGWFDTGKTQWVSTGQCTEKEQKEQEYRDYYCDATLDCQYSITATEWVDTGVTRNKEDGITCDDGLYCNVGETCQSGVCRGELARVCDDGESCTTDSCNEEKDSCEYIWPACGLVDSCCGPECDYTNDRDCPAVSTMHVGDITFDADVRSWGRWGSWCKVTAYVPILDSSDVGVKEAEVYGTWSGAYSKGVSGSTNGEAIATFKTSWVRDCGTFTFCVDNVIKTDWIYDSTKNKETCDSVTLP